MSIASLAEAGAVPTWVLTSLGMLTGRSWLPGFSFVQGCGIFLGFQFDSSGWLGHFPGKTRWAASWVAMINKGSVVLMRWKVPPGRAMASHPR